MNRWIAVCAVFSLWLLPNVERALAMESGLKQLRCVQVHVDVEQDPAVRSRGGMTEEDLRQHTSSTLQAALPLLSLSQSCGNRFRVLLVLHDVPSGGLGGYNGLLITGIERVATLAETGDRQEVEVWSGGIQEFRGPLDGVSTTARRALARSLTHFAEAYRLSGNP